MCDVIRKSENVSFDWPSSRGAFDNLTAIRSPHNRRLDMPTTALLAGHVTQQQVLVYSGNAASFSCSFVVLHRATRRRRLRRDDISDGDEQRSIQRQRQKYAVSADIYVSGFLPRRRHFMSERCSQRRWRNCGALTPSKDSFAKRTNEPLCVYGKQILSKFDLFSDA